jgi:hypothetical protein
MDLFIGNESQVLTVAAKWSLELGRLVTKDQVIKVARANSDDRVKDVNAQRSYVRMIEKLMSELDDKIFSGEWKSIRTVPSDPFIISDAPVVTWRRDNGGLSYGLGFHEADVEVVLPISPVVCLHILPQVQRSSRPRRPTVREVNTLQAAFAARYCFSNIESAAVDRICQENLGKARMGANCFTV